MQPSNLKKKNKKNKQTKFKKQRVHGSPNTCTQNEIQPCDLRIPHRNQCTHSLQISLRVASAARNFQKLGASMRDIRARKRRRTRRRVIAKTSQQVPCFLTPPTTTDFRVFYQNAFCFTFQSPMTIIPNCHDFDFFYLFAHICLVYVCVCVCINSLQYMRDKK